MINAIGNAPLAVTPAPVFSAPPAGNITALTPTNPVPAQSGTGDRVNISSQATQQLGQPKVQYANPEVLGTEAVTMYMVDGQLYTRYRNEITNKVTYIPKEAQVLPGNSGSTTQSFNITA